MVLGIRCPRRRRGHGSVWNRPPAKNASHMLRIDLAESVGRPEGTQQFLWSWIYGSEHSTPYAGSLDLSSDLVPDSPIGEMLAVGSALVQPAKPLKAHRVSPLMPVGEALTASLRRSWVPPEKERRLGHETVAYSKAWEHRLVLGC